MCLMSDAGKGSGIYVSSGGVARQFQIILEEVDLRVEPTCYDVIFFEDMGKMDVWLDDVFSSEWNGADFPCRDLIMLILQCDLVRVGGWIFPDMMFLVSFLLVNSIFLNQFRKNKLIHLEIWEKLRIHL